jgi:hypothetical protein
MTDALDGRRRKSTRCCHSAHRKADIKIAQLELERQESSSPRCGYNETSN